MTLTVYGILIVSNRNRKDDIGMKQRNLYAVMLAGGILGTVAAFIQTLEKLALLKNKDAVLACDLNSVFSCSTVLNSWQFSVFGFPNSIMCMALFIIFATIAVVGLSGGRMPRQLRLGVQLLSLFTLGFGLWVLWQSTYVINALCIYCIFCFLGLIMLNWSWLRTNAADLPISSKQRKTLAGWINTGADTFAWILFGLVVAFAMALRFI
jgi:uncharacterized membrane protein